MKSRAIVVGVLPVATVAQLTSSAFAGSGEAEFAFQKTLQRTDLPVSSGSALRTWIWGTEPVTPVMIEQYAEAPGGARPEQYYDKS